MLALYTSMTYNKYRKYVNAQHYKEGDPDGSKGYNKALLYYKNN